MQIDFDNEELQALYQRCNGYLPEPNSALRRAVAKISAAQQPLALDGLKPEQKISNIDEDALRQWVYGASRRK